MIKQRVLGLDVGEKRIGVALSDNLGILATPLLIIEFSEETEAINRILSLVAERDIGKIIVGLPFSMKGNIGSQANLVKTFAEHLLATTSVQIEYRDERLSTVTAIQMMRDTHPKKPRHKIRTDAIAAAVILQGYLDEERQLP